MGVYIGKDRKARRVYGFDEIALVPGKVTINPEEVNTHFSLGGEKFPIPFIASAMDGVVDVKFAGEMGKLGGLAVLNLEGVQTRYANPEPALKTIASTPSGKSTAVIQKIYEKPIKKELITRRVKEIKSRGVICAVSAIPQNAVEFGRIAQEAGCDLFVAQSTVTTLKHISSQYPTVDFKKLCKQLRIPVVIGNTVGYRATMDLLQTGCAGILVGIGPGAACTTRGVLGIGVPQVTATIDCAAARNDYYKHTKKYVPIITDGGMTTGGDVCKALACGADAVMIGSAFARAKEAPGKGFHWGMAMPHQYLPRGTKIKVGVTGTLEEILYGPARIDDGTQNLVGALRTSMGSLGMKNIKEMHRCEIAIAPAIKTEGKIFQTTQRIGMGK